MYRYNTHSHRWIHIDKYIHRQTWVDIPKDPYVDKPLEADIQRPVHSDTDRQIQTTDTQTNPDGRVRCNPDTDTDKRYGPTKVAQHCECNLNLCY